MILSSVVALYIAPAIVSESGCQSISIPAPEEDTSTSSVKYLRSRASFQHSTPGMCPVNFGTR